MNRRNLMVSLAGLTAGLSITSQVVGQIDDLGLKCFQFLAR